MKNITIYLLFIAVVISGNVYGQEFVELQNGEDQHVNGMMAGFSMVKKETKKGADLYNITTTITNQSANYVRIFETSRESFSKKPENALAYFQFTNATGKALSARNAYLYPSPQKIKVPYKCKKCPPLKEDEDPYNRYTKSVIVGIQFLSGATQSKVSKIRVPEGELPKVRVIIY